MSPGTIPTATCWAGLPTAVTPCCRLPPSFTVPLWIYKALILAWALWLSFALLRWLPWVWQCFSSDGFWRIEKGEAYMT